MVFNLPSIHIQYLHFEGKKLALTMYTIYFQLSLKSHSMLYHPQVVTHNNVALEHKSIVGFSV